MSTTPTKTRFTHTDASLDGWGPSGDMNWCAVCGIPAHLIGTTVFSRAEDAPCVPMHIPIVGGPGGGAAELPPFQDGNPSLRRSGMILYFRCEGGHDYCLDVANHKGDVLWTLRTWE